MKDLEEILSQNFLDNSHKRKTVCNSLTNSIHEIKKLQLCSEEINEIGNVLPKRRRYREEPMDYNVHDPIFNPENFFHRFNGHLGMIDDLL